MVANHASVTGKCCVALSRMMHWHKISSTRIPASHLDTDMTSCRCLAASFISCREQLVQPVTTTCILCRVVMAHYTYASKADAKCHVTYGC